MPLELDGQLVYILRSELNGRFYIGCTDNVARRFERHNRGEVKATKYLLPWTLVYTELCGDMTLARQREWQLKRQKSRKVLEALVSSVG